MQLLRLLLQLLEAALGIDVYRIFRDIALDKIPRQPRSVLSSRRLAPTPSRLPYDVELLLEVLGRLYICVSISVLSTFQQTMAWLTLATLFVKPFQLIP